MTVDTIYYSEVILNSIWWGFVCFVGCSLVYAIHDVLTIEDTNGA